jgi:hypothetical protein
MTTQPIESVKRGAVILPPERELSLWMRRHCRELGLPETAMYLTVRDICEGSPDKRGRWVRVMCDHTPAWLQGRPAYSFTFKARPSTLWPVIE